MLNLVVSKETARLQKVTSVGGLSIIYRVSSFRVYLKEHNLRAKNVIIKYVIGKERLGKWH